MTVRRAMLSLFAVIAIASRAGAEMFQVTVPTDGGDGVCDQNCSLREALAAANALPDGDEILVPAGVYELSAGVLRIEADVAIHGARSGELGAGDGETVVDAGGASRVFEVATGVGALLRGLTVRGGTASNGGGILNDGILEIREARVTENRAFGTVIGACHQTAPPVFQCLQQDGMGGGVYNRGELVVRDSTVDGNFAVNDNNKCFISPSMLAWTPCITLQQGGGIANDGLLTVVNSTVSGNGAFDDSVIYFPDFGYASGSGCGGILSSGTLVLRNGTVTDNTAGDDGAGLCSLGEVSFSNTIVALNRLGTFHPEGWECRLEGSVSANAHNLEWSFADEEGVEVQPSCGFSGSDLLGVDPRLGPLADNGGATPTHALLAGSMAIDAGSADPPGSGGTSCEATDQRGVPRPQGERCDIGAYEAPLGGSCAGDCDDDGRVDIAELIRGVRISLGFEALAGCASFDVNEDETVSIAELVRVVRYLLVGCPASA